MKPRVCLLIFLLLTLSGCLMASGEDLLRPPKPPQVYTELREHISALLDSGYRYRAPTGGLNRQPIQMTDLNGDGMDDALVFLGQEGGAIRIYIYQRESDGEYSEICHIEQQSEQLDSVQYADLDGDGNREIIAGWRTAGLKNLTVYSYDGYTAVPQMSVDYTFYIIAAMTGDQTDNLVILRSDAAGLTGVAELYGRLDGGLALLSSAPLSDGMEAITRVVTGILADGRAAVLVGGRYQKDYIVTDIITLREDTLQNITRDPSLGVSVETVRAYRVQTADVTGDGLVDIPKPTPLPPYTADALEASYYRVEWRSYRSSGEYVPVLYTVHNLTDGWYLTLPESWRDRLTVTRRDTVAGERSMVFALLGDGLDPPVDLLVLDTTQAKDYTLGSRSLLGQHGDTTVLATFPEVPAAYRAFVPTPEEAAAMLHWIPSQWITGETLN
jgi:hypothetical protein